MNRPEGELIREYRSRPNPRRRCLVIHKLRPSDAHGGWPRRKRPRRLGAPSGPGNTGNSVTFRRRAMVKFVSYSRSFAFVRGLFFLLALAVAANAQTSRGTVTGAILDPTGAVIGGAQVTLTSVE